LQQIICSQGHSIVVTLEWNRCKIKALKLITEENKQISFGLLIETYEFYLNNL